MWRTTWASGEKTLAPGRYRAGTPIRACSTTLAAKGQRPSNRDAHYRHRGTQLRLVVMRTSDRQLPMRRPPELRCCVPRLWQLVHSDLQVGLPLGFQAQGYVCDCLLAWRRQCSYPRVAGEAGARSMLFRLLRRMKRSRCYRAHYDVQASIS